MDAHQLEFKDEAFDAIVLPFVVTLVSDPDRVLAEAIRVARPGCRVVLVNNFYSEQGLLAAIERKSGAALRKIGLNPEFSYSRIADYVAGDVRVCELTRIPAERFFTLVTIGRRA